MTSGASQLPTTNRGVKKPKESGLDALIDWVQVTFKNVSLDDVINHVLQIPKRWFTYEKRGRFRYAGKYVCEDIEILVAPDDYKEMGLHLYLTGKACRDMEKHLSGQKRTWFDFFKDCVKLGGSFTRLDIAIDDKGSDAGKLYFDIHKLKKKIEKGELISKLKKWSYYDSGAIDGERAGRTINFGSRISNVYIVFYEKNYEQAEKYEKPVEEIGLWNRYEIRLRKDAADICIEELVRSQGLEYIAKSVLNTYLRFVVRKDSEKKRNRWPVWKPWLKFIEDTEKLKLSTAPAPLTLERKIVWIEDYVAPSLNIIARAGEYSGRDFLGEAIKGAKVQQKHEKVLEEYKIRSSETSRYYESIKDGLSERIELKKSGFSYTEELGIKNEFEEDASGRY